jgi:hypothetical protein
VPSRRKSRGISAISLSCSDIVSGPAVVLRNGRWYCLEMRCMKIRALNKCSWQGSARVFLPEKRKLPRWPRSAVLLRVAGAHCITLIVSASLTRALEVNTQPISYLLPAWSSPATGVSCADLYWRCSATHSHSETFVYGLFFPLSTIVSAHLVLTSSNTRLAR